MSVAVQQEKIQLDIDGMNCGGCASKVQRVLADVDGVEDAVVNLALERADVIWIDPAAGRANRLVEAVEQAGYGATLRQGTARERREKAEADAARKLAQHRRDLLLLILSALLTIPFLIQMGLMMTGQEMILSPYAELILVLPVQFGIGLRFYKGAWKSIRAGGSNMDVLIAMGTSAAFFFSLYQVILHGDHHPALYFEASAVIITMVLVGKWLEARARSQASEAIRSLFALQPSQALRLDRASGEEHLVEVEDIIPGDWIKVRAGDRFAVDGVVAEGASDVDEALVTGESLPVHKSVGDRVVTGSVNATSPLIIEATAVGEDSVLSRIIRLVDGAQAARAPVQQLVDRISQVFVPTIIVIALVTFAGWLFTGHSFEAALIAGTAVLVIACPCALGLATPTALVAGTGAASRAGILIRDIEVLNRAHEVDRMVFDKTGTLTMGEPELVDVESLSGNRDESLSIAKALQADSTHPLADAVLKAEGGDKQKVAQSVQNHAGHGLAGLIDGAEWRIGQPEWFEPLDQDLHEKVEKARLTGGTVSLLGDEKAPVAIFIFRDRIRLDMANVIRSLDKIGVEAVMLTGDGEEAAAQIAGQAGIKTFEAKVKPSDKSRHVKALQTEGHVVAMVGDGINDAPALAQADVGIAMGSGTDAAMEAASITLMRSEPHLMPAAISISRATLRKIRQNLFWAFFYNIIGVPLAAFGLLSPAVAGAAMAASSVSVVSNALLLRSWKPEK